MAKHRRPKKRRSHAAMVAAAAAGLSGAMVLGHATNADFMVRLTAEVTNSVIGAGGLGDNLGARVPDKLSETVVPPGYVYVPLMYDSTLDLSGSQAAGVPVLNQAILDHASDQKIIATGYSAGTLAIEQERRNLQAADPADAPSNSQLAFELIASPFAPNGGVFGRFPQNIVIPGIVDFTGPTQPTRYDTTYVSNEYDPYDDFPAYFNPVALLNTALAVEYAHSDPYYDAIQPGVTPSFTTTVTNGSTGSTDTYVLYYNNQLPLLAPIRGVAAMVPFGSTFVEPEVSAIEPLLRVVVDMAYTDRENLDPATPTPFSLITPPAKIIQAAGQVPGALVQGLTNLLAGGNAAPPPASETHEVTTPAVVSAAATPAVKTLNTNAVQRSVVQQQPDSTGGADPTASGTSTPSGAGSGTGSTTPGSSTPPVNKVTPTAPPTGGKVKSPTTAPNTGSGHSAEGVTSSTTPPAAGVSTPGGTTPSSSDNSGTSGASGSDKSAA